MEDKFTSPGVRKNSFLTSLPTALRPAFIAMIGRGHARLIQDASTGQEYLEVRSKKGAPRLLLQAMKKGIKMVKVHKTHRPRIG